MNEESKRVVRGIAAATLSARRKMTITGDGHPSEAWEALAKLFDAILKEFPEAFQSEPEPETEAEVLRKGIEAQIDCWKKQISPYSRGRDAIPYEVAINRLEGILESAGRARAQAEREAE